MNVDDIGGINMVYEIRGKTFDEFNVGDEFTTASRTITESDVVTFAGLSGDFNPIHMDKEFADNSPLKGRVAHGMLVESIATGLGNQLGIYEGTTIAVLSITINFKGTVKFGDTIHLKLTVTDKKESSKPGRGVVTFQTTVLNQRDETVIDGQWVVMMTRKTGE
jgi:acyl dehydratase